jgi:hypothetical protein
MNRIFKTLLAWLLTAVLPLQGMAAAVQSSCGSSHHALMMPNASAMHHHGGDMVHSHDSDSAAMQSLTHDESANVQASTDNSLSSKHRTSTCGACAVCVGAVAPPSATLWAPAYGRSESVAVSPATMFTGYIPTSLERPPKRIFA